MVELMQEASANDSDGPASSELPTLPAQWDIVRPPNAAVALQSIDRLRAIGQPLAATCAVLNGDHRQAT